MTPLKGALARPEGKREPNQEQKAKATISALLYDQRMNSLRFAQDVGEKGHILGLHKIEDRPVAQNSEVVIRPMMYVALSYDHRIVDGR